MRPSRSPRKHTLLLSWHEDLPKAELYQYPVFDNFHGHPTDQTCLCWQHRNKQNLQELRLVNHMGSYSEHEFDFSQLQYNNSQVYSRVQPHIPMPRAHETGGEPIQQEHVFQRSEVFESPTLCDQRQAKGF